MQNLHKLRVGIREELVLGLESPRHNEKTSGGKKRKEKRKRHDVAPLLLLQRNRQTCILLLQCYCIVVLSTHIRVALVCWPVCP